ncbi:unnamed protein product [Echinostoma caproni]|uniref:HECT domain-containing protein n=1 Tax=Echinostoma caproni TaxID=27848 RepID=A0A183AX87_9TREM|nr:unnamed protein product [Echinostoma caproni]
MKVPWPDAFEDGDVRTFLEEFEDGAEMVGIGSDRGSELKFHDQQRSRMEMFLEDFEGVAELAGIRTDCSKLTALPALLKGCARAVLDAARRDPEKM